MATTVWTSLDAARDLVGPWAEPARGPGMPRGKHPVLIEAWRVRGGKWESAAGTQHDWAERAGQAAGVALGARGALGDLFRGWSEAAARAGSYNEVVLTIPARLPGDAAIYAFVAGMYTDSPVALWGDLTMQCGYRKRLARISWPSPWRCEVVSPAGEPLLSLDWRAARSGRPTAGMAGPRAAMPFLGGLDDGRYAISTMERTFDARAMGAAVTARAVGHAGLVEGLPALDGSTEALSARRPLGAFRFEGVPTRLSYPRHARL